MAAKDIRTIGRATQGVRLIDIEGDDRRGLDRASCRERRRRVGSVAYGQSGGGPDVTSSDLGCALLIIAACSSPPIEQQVLTTFFRAARVRDNTTLASISAVNFDPRTDGSVQDFTIDSIGAQQHRKLELQQLTDEQDKVRAEQVEFTKKMRDFYQSNSIAIDRAAKAQQAKQTVTREGRGAADRPGRNGTATAAISNGSSRRRVRRSRTRRRRPSPA